MQTIQHLTAATFDEVTEKPGLTVVDFWASWCWPCRVMAPQLERAAELRPDCQFAKVDVDAEPGLAQRFGIASIPTLLVLRDGEPIAAQTGVVPAEQLADALDRITRRDEAIA